MSGVADCTIVKGGERERMVLHGGALRMARSGKKRKKYRRKKRLKVEEDG